MSQDARPTPQERKPLQAMTLAERADWYANQAAELEDFATYAQTPRTAKDPHLE